MDYRTPPTDEPDLRDLPRGPRTARRVTLAVLGVTALAATSLMVALLPEASYALTNGAPENVGQLAQLDLTRDDGNRWVRGTGAVTDRAVRYRRPLDGDGYRLAQVEGNEELWVQMRIPEGMREEHFVPPASFVGRLLPLDSAGLRYGRLDSALGEVGADPDRARLLIDGEAPVTTRWRRAFLALFVGISVFVVFALVRLIRPVRDPEH